ncbi:ubiquitin-specific protease otu1, partial [Cladochytrium tenue]
MRAYHYQRIRCRGPGGAQATVGAGLTPTSTLDDLRLEVAQALGMPASRVQIKAGFPPRVLVQPGSSTLSECGVRDGDQLVVERLPDPPPAPPPTASLELEGLGVVCVREMPDDNSCLFHALAYLVDRSSTAAKMRETAAAAILSDPDTFSDAVLGRPRAAYAAWIQQPGSWGGAVELAALARALGIDLASIDVATGRLDHFPAASAEVAAPKDGVAGAAGAGTAVLVYSGIHYDAVAVAPDLAAPADTDTTVLQPPMAGRVLEAAGVLAARLRE